MRGADAADSDFVLVNLFRGKVGAPMRPDAVSLWPRRRAGRTRHRCGPTNCDMPMAATSSMPGPERCVANCSGMHRSLDGGLSASGLVRPRAAVDAVPSPREQVEVTR